MKYELILQGNKTIIINENDRQTIIMAEKNNISTIEIKENRFKLSMIKGIFRVKEEVSDNKKAWIESNREWHELCLMMSKKNIKEKMEKEMKNRILPGLKLNNISLSEEANGIILYNIKIFFESNPLYPRCPMYIWWPFIANFILPKNKKNPPIITLGKWWEYVARNDNEIQEWIEYNK